MDKKEEAIGVLATGILHYLLTNALLNSQRKIDHNGIELDIVIPDVKTLEKDAKMTLLILIPKSSDKRIIDEKISQLKYPGEKRADEKRVAIEVTLDYNSKN